MNNISEVAVIVPAHNEAERIDSVLNVLSKVDRINEIIVVDDGSCDGTANKVRDAVGRDKRIRLLQHPHNLGKGQAILTGRNATKAPILLLLDADLSGLEPVQVLALIEPIIDQKLDMTLGLFKGGRLLTDFSHWLTPWLTGQRCIRTSILDELDANTASGYGFETALTLAAAHRSWRTGIVWLQGVWHPPSELHRGLLHGLWRRARMYFQIVRAWYLAKGWSILWRKARKKILLLFVSIFLLGYVVFVRYDFVAYSAAASEFGHLPIFTINDVHRILVIAPHPDDETLAAGGVIQQALTEGSQVKAVIVTNGDGQKFAPVVLNEKLIPRPQDYIAMGQRRRAESTTALERLGMQKKDIVFLGYPDRGTNPMWLADWNTQCPYTAYYTRAKRDPYPDTFHAGDEYCGSDLLHDLQTIIEDYRPDLVILPHPADQNPDHGAVSNFTRLAIAMTITHDKSYAPKVWAYIVHYGKFPQPRGKHFSQILLPPKYLIGMDNSWGRVDLSSTQVSIKYSAIEDYPSQDLLLREFLPSFARRNELFESLPIQTLPPTSFGLLSGFAHTSTKDYDGYLPVVNNEDFPVKGNLITGWQMTRVDDKIWLAPQMKRDILPDLDCTVYLKLPDGRTNRLYLTPINSVFSPREFGVQVDLSTLGDPSVIAFAAEIKQGGIIVSKTGWHILVLK